MVPDRPGVRDERPGDEPRHRARVRGTRELQVRPRRSAARHRRPQHRVVRVARARGRLPAPDHPRGHHRRDPAPPGRLHRPRLPPRRHPARRGRPAVAVLLQRLADGRVQLDPRRGGRGPDAVAPGLDDGDAVDRPRGHLGGRRRDRDHLPRRPARGPARAVRGRRGGRRIDLAEDLARHPAPAARGPVRDPDPAAHRDVAAVHRAAPVHRRRTGERDDDRAAADLPVRVREQPGWRLREGGRAERHARGVPRGVHRDLLPVHPRLEHAHEGAVATVGQRPAPPPSPTAASSPGPTGGAAASGGR